MFVDVYVLIHRHCAAVVHVVEVLSLLSPHYPSASLVPFATTRMRVRPGVDMAFQRGVLPKS